MNFNLHDAKEQGNRSQKKESGQIIQKNAEAIDTAWPSDTMPMAMGLTLVNTKLDEIIESVISLRGTHNSEGELSIVNLNFRHKMCINL